MCSRASETECVEYATKCVQDDTECVRDASRRYECVHDANECAQYATKCVHDAPMTPAVSVRASEMCSGSEAVSYLRRIDFVYHSTLGLRVIKKRRASVDTTSEVEILKDLYLRAKTRIWP